MGVKPSKEELNFLKFSYIVHNEFPKMLRLTFVKLWNLKIAPLPGFQVWDDTPAVRKLLLKLEGGTTAIPTDKSFQDWDFTALLQATLYSKTFGISTKDTIKTLNDQFIKGKKPSSFLVSLRSSTGNQDETITLAIYQVQWLRNCLCHLPERTITKFDFDNYVQRAKDAFTAVEFSTKQIDHICNLEELHMLTEYVDEFNQSVLLESQEKNNPFLEHPIQNFDRIEEKVNYTHVSGTGNDDNNK